MSNHVKPKSEIKAKVTITLEPDLICYAQRLGRSNVSLGIRHALIEYRNKLDLEQQNSQLPTYARADSEGVSN